MSDNKLIVQAATDLTLALINKPFEGDKLTKLTKEDQVKRAADVFRLLVTELKPVIKSLD